MLLDYGFFVDDVMIGISFRSFDRGHWALWDNPTSQLFDQFYILAEVTEPWGPTQRVGANPTFAKSCTFD